MGLMPVFRFPLSVGMFIFISVSVPPPVQWVRVPTSSVLTHREARQSLPSIDDIKNATFGAPYIFLSRCLGTRKIPSSF